MKEIWKTISEMKTYEISNFGNVRKKLMNGYSNLKPSANEAKRQTGFSQGHISEVCRGEKKKYKNYIWKYC